MERAALLIEETGESLSCLLNPEGLVFQRSAGLRRREWGGAKLTNASGDHDPLLPTGGGTTQLRLDLLFDVDLPGVGETIRNVKDLTGPLWRLSEGSAGRGTDREPPTIRFVWGKAWNERARVAAVSERFDRFSPQGAPLRSWLRLLLVLVDEERLEPAPLSSGGRQRLDPTPDLDLPFLEDEVLDDGDDFEFIEVHGDGHGGAGDRVDQLAAKYLGGADRWRDLADLNGLDEPLGLDPGRLIRVPAGGGGA